MAISHPKWLIDEYPNIFRTDVWLIPPSLPIIVDQIIDKLIIKLLLILLIIINGATFCQVINIRHLFHSIFDIISGIHAWKGAAPILIKILIVIITLLIIFMKVVEYIIFKIIIIRIILLTL